jgi:Mn-dependent DtxR family transcriptional regulator
MDVSAATIAVSLKKLEKGGYINKVMDEGDNRLNQITMYHSHGTAPDLRSRHFYVENHKSFSFCAFLIAAILPLTSSLR